MENKALVLLGLGVALGAACSAAGGRAVDGGSDAGTFDPPDAGRLASGRISMVRSTSVAGDLAGAFGAGTIIPGGGEPARGQADWYAPGVLVADLTGDGRPEILLPRYDNTRPDLRRNLLYRNDGSGRFTDMTDAAGVGGGENTACAMAGDVDNDGDLDLFIGNDLAPSKLLLNDGAGGFVDGSAESGLDVTLRVFTAAWVDFDHDGRLDLYVGTWDDAGPNGHYGGATSHISPNVLFRQGADGRFDDVTAAAGVACHGRSTLALGFADLDGDGWEDLYVANDFFDDCLYLNNGDGTFREVTEAWGAGPDAITGMGVAFGDADNDGDLDLYVADDLIPDGSTGSVFYRNDGDGFASMAPELGLAGRFTWGTVFADFDNDGDVDLFGATIVGSGPFLLYENEGGLCFEETGARAAADFRDARGVAVGDVDDDGRLDLVVALRRAPLELFLNRTEGGHYLRVRAVGRRANRAGIGAWIEVEVGGARQVRTIVAGDSYRSGSELVAHFGLGEAVRADRVTVTFPGGGTVTQLDVPADQELLIRE